MGRVEEHLWAVIVTHRRPDCLRLMLDVLREQTVAPARVIVIDNAPTRTNELLVQHRQRKDVSYSYVAAPKNLGPAGGIALGMKRFQEDAPRDSWLLLLDDDDPPYKPTLIEDLYAFAQQTKAQDEKTAGVGVTGGIFDFSTGRMGRIPNGDLHGPITVDVIAGNKFPCYHIDAIRTCGTYNADLFFGFEELEYGLRTTRQYALNLYAMGDEWLARRTATKRLDCSVGPSPELGPYEWHRYYSLRNLIAILIEHEYYLSATRVALIHGIAKPGFNIPKSPRRALTHLRGNMKAILDATLGRMGQRVLPANPTCDNDAAQ